MINLIHISVLNVIVGMNQNVVNLIIVNIVLTDLNTLYRLNNNLGGF